ncbi:MAG: hypothetical protein H6741_08405 [Alphaproteobacteria bacterium]|nr:hypothetical protein [Alphaproteobacteria bacterium]MCB9792738.1 hypothetical protein [Alphaproteobacteria bacterium]
MLALSLLLACAPESAEHAVRVTLDDGQVLLGDITTDTLFLESGLGTLAIPLGDVGEVEPVEGGALGGSGDHVTVWLRDGSELSGRWKEPELAMAIQVGGGPVPVELPTAQLQRLQTQGGEVWPEGDVFRVATIYGDDFIVDPSQTHLTLVNALGSFSPALTEMASLTPLDGTEGDWVIQLFTGTVLIGPLEGDAVTLALRMGPESVEVPLDALVSIERQAWSPGYYAAPIVNEEALPAETGEAELQQTVAPPAARSSPSGWFDNSMMRQSKQVVR